ncbi:MAG: hypothetical protein AMXMBFR53_37560 [Gemmatimonadota bacterium]
MPTLRSRGDAPEALAHAAAHPPEAHRIITADARPCGYVCWQRLSAADRATAGLQSLPADHVDIDILIGEDDCLGHGIGPQALLLVAEHLIAEGVSSAGLGTDPGNPRACRAFPKAGFTQRTELQQDGRPLTYFTRALGAVV